jgi:broad specificity phosphatase PhoE
VALLYLIRHAACESVGRRLACDVPGVGLNAEGERQARSLSDRLAQVPFDAVYTSPLERARATALSISRGRGLEVQIAEGIAEIRFGDWGGRTFDELRESPSWRRWNDFRSFARPPGGESISEVQARSLREIERMVAATPDGTLAVVSHGDVIKAVVAWFLGMPIDLCHRLEIDPGSVSMLAVEPWGARVLRLNDSTVG